MLRLVAAARRAGVARVGLPAAWRCRPIMRWLTGDAGLRRTVVWLDDLDPVGRLAVRRRAGGTSPLSIPRDAERTAAP